MCDLPKLQIIWRQNPSITFFVCPQRDNLSHIVLPEQHKHYNFVAHQRYCESSKLTGAKNKTWKSRYLSDSLRSSQGSGEGLGLQSIRPYTTSLKSDWLNTCQSTNAWTGEGYQIRFWRPWLHFTCPATVLEKNLIGWEPQILELLSLHWQQSIQGRHTL